MAEIKKKCELYEIEIIQLKQKVTKLERLVAKKGIEEAKIAEVSSDSDASS